MPKSAQDEIKCAFKDCQKIAITDAYFVVLNKGDFVLAQKVINKEDGSEYLSTYAVYQNLVSLLNDFVHRSVSALIYTKQITTAKDFTATLSRLGGLCESVMDKLNK
ncbi:DUF5405 family protein [Rouxiella badensis]|uniref:DUF5405 family protein n=1 Tax=Rouxiella badensis TaxID=1646377 RepID=UPI001D15D514|nr:DUF5405 family protein [Rouxiella badensis]MCC3704143.1 DUF5405 family protein [Rouxiella badensis]